MNKSITVLSGAALLAIPMLCSGTAMGKTTDDGNSWIVAQATNSYSGATSSSSQDSSSDSS